jgi:hypothetical protein
MNLKYNIMQGKISNSKNPLFRINPNSLFRMILSRCFLVESTYKKLGSPQKFLCQ